MADVVNAGTPPIGGWCGMGCFFNLSKAESDDALAALTSATDNADANGAPEKYSGDMVVVQGGSGNYGQRTPVKVFVVSANTIIIERTVLVDKTQTAVLSKIANATLSGTEYKQFLGNTMGEGADGDSVLRFE